jgi:predicted ArsR family transcriptional regulator
MDQPTRKFLAVLSSDPCGAICDRLEIKPASKMDLIEELGLQSREVASVLDALLLVGLVRHRSIRDGNPGRPPEVWELTGLEELAALEAYVKQLRHRLIDAG